MREKWQRFSSNKFAVAGLVTIILIVAGALLAPLLTAYDPIRMSTDYAVPPSHAHLLGTDAIGRDIFSRLLYAGRASIVVGLCVPLCSALIGVSMGVIAGYMGGKADMVIMRVADILMSFPLLIFMLTINSIIGAGLWQIILVMGIMTWPRMSRLVRSKVLTLREQDFVKSAQTMGFRTPRILFFHIVPSLTDIILVQTTFSIAFAILMESSLSFLGLGINPPTASWGNMLTDARNISYLTTMPWLWIPPGMMIMASVMSFNFIGDGLSHALDPKS